MHKVVVALVTSAAILLTSGCASIVSKSQWPVTVNSNPSGANVTIKNKRGVEVQKGATPMTIYLPSGAGFFSPASYQLEFAMDGYNPTNALLSAGMNGWYIGNIIFGGLIGILIVDPATGAMWRLQDTVSCELTPNPNAAVVSIEDATAVSTNKPGETSQDVPAQLKELKELKDSGALADEEYETRRKNLVEKL